MTRRPVLQRKRFQTTLTVTIRQNATRTPGDSARFTRVELSEKAMTTPTTASTPNVFALSRDEAVVVMRLLRSEDRRRAEALTMV